MNNAFKRLNQIGIALSAERNPRYLLELVLAGARELTGADAGTLYETSGLSEDRRQLDVAQGLTPARQPTAWTIGGGRQDARGKALEAEQPSTHQSFTASHAAADSSARGGATTADPAHLPDSGTVAESGVVPALHFALVQNDTLGLHFGGTGEPLGEQFQPLDLYQADGTPNSHMVVAQAALKGQTLRIDDAYDNEEFDFSGTRTFDQKTGYRTRSVLVVPLRNHAQEVIGALQLINKTSAGQVAAFSAADQEIAESLASQAAVAMTNQRLIGQMQELFDSFTEMLAHAIDAKSPQTGAHCRRVPDATLMLAEAASQAQTPGVEQFRLSEADYQELKTAAWLHDVGKVVTPHHIVEKATKLELLSDNIELVGARLNAAHKDAQLAVMKRALSAGSGAATEAEASSGQAQEGLAQHGQVEAELARLQKQYQHDWAFLQQANTGGEFMADEDLERLQQLAQRTYRDLAGHEQPLLSAAELDYLSIRRGTLTAAEKKVMEDHMVHTLDMLEQLPFPRHLQRVPEFAGGHHERMDGKGYPRGLTREQLSIPARIMGIADVFEALTAPERSYKQPMPLSQTLTIMCDMAGTGHLDPDLFRVFVAQEVYQQYAERYLAAEQRDAVNPEELLTELARKLQDQD